MRECCSGGIKKVQIVPVVPIVPAVEITLPFIYSCSMPHAPCSMLLCIETILFDNINILLDVQFLAIKIESNKVTQVRI